MRVLIVGLNFHPEPTGIGKYTGEFSSYLAGHGHEVRVITTPPYYPHWQVRPGYHAWKYLKEAWQEVEILRCPLWVPRHPTGFTRLIHLATFAVSSIPALIAQLQWRPNLVLCVAPALMNAPFALAFARLCGAKAWLHIQDFELDASLKLGLLPGGKQLAHLALRLERLLLVGFDKVSSISERMLAQLAEKGLPQNKIALFPNWVDTCQIFRMQTVNPMRAELEIEVYQKVILYHGNIGRKQGLEILIEAAALLQAHPEILFIVCGEGAARAELKKRATRMKNVRFIDLQPFDKLNSLVNLADLHVLPQRAGVADLVMPSKLTTMLASGKPVLACALPGTQVWKIVHQVGKVVPPDDSQALSEAIVRLLNDPDECERLSKLGRKYTCQFLEKEVILSKFKHELQTLRGS